VEALGSDVWPTEMFQLLTIGFTGTSREASSRCTAQTQIMTTKNQDIPKDVIVDIYKAAPTLSGNMVKRDMDVKQLSRLRYGGTR
jgi:hypothetical protein